MYTNLMSKFNFVNSAVFTQIPGLHSPCIGLSNVAHFVWFVALMPIAVVVAAMIFLGCTSDRRHFEEAGVQVAALQGERQQAPKEKRGGRGGGGEGHCAPVERVGICARDRA